ncbi:unnamed protein product [Lactuca virosa]|uniref:WRKY domain-containing protein n=1 Tax=Lactuca virosa TaxID=75947 RepID=A0AAU9NBM2_9ASTR|nr:unnamed protein product [Lactuca virosa]
MELEAMDTKELMMMMMMIKMENQNNPYPHMDMDIPSDPFSSLPVLDQTAFGSEQKTSLGFMELLQGGFHDHNYSSPSSSSIFDINNMMMMMYHHDHQLPSPPSSSSAHPHSNQHDHDHYKEEDVTVDEVAGEESSISVVLNVHPSISSPNASSLSSPQPAAAAAATVDQLHKPLKQCMESKRTKVDGDDERKTLKKKKKKKEREARFAFMTRTEIDHLDDGYRWRKYGQKAVKNSPFPRSYYRCTSASCNVKKRVERCMGDPSFVVTTYEGQHIHPSPSPSAAPTIKIPSFNHHLNNSIIINPTTYN